MGALALTSLKDASRPPGALGLGALSAAIASPVVPPTPGEKFSDDFTYANGALDVVGAAKWSLLSGTSGAIQVASNSLTVPSAVSGFYSAASLNWDNVYIEYKTRWTVGANNGVGFIINTTNYIYVRQSATSGGRWEIVYRSGGGNVILASFVAAIPANDSTVLIEKVGLSITVKLNGGTIVTGVIPDTASNLAGARMPLLLVSSGTGGFIDTLKAGVL